MATGEGDVSHALRHVRQVVLAAMRRDGFYLPDGTKSHVPLPWDINNGQCEEFAELAVRAIPGSCAEDLYDEHDLAHVVVVIDGRYYDAETLDGVDSVQGLPIAGVNPRPTPIPGGGCAETTEAIGLVYECRLAAGHKGRHQVASFSWR